MWGKSVDITSCGDRDRLARSKEKLSALPLISLLLFENRYRSRGLSPRPAWPWLTNHSGTCHSSTAWISKYWFIGPLFVNISKTAGEELVYSEMYKHNIFFLRSRFHWYYVLVKRQVNVLWSTFLCVCPAQGLNWHCPTGQYSRGLKLWLVYLVT